MRELGRYKVTIRVTVDLVAFDALQAVGGAFDQVNDLVNEAIAAGMDNVRITGLAQDMDGEDMVYRYDSVKVENLV